MQRSILFWSLLLGFLVVFGPACKYRGERVRVPVAIPRDTATADTSKEGENKTATTVALPAQTIPLPPPNPLPAPLPPKRRHSSKAAKKEASAPAVTEQSAIPPTAQSNTSPLQLAPDIPEKEKNELIFKTDQELKSANDLLNNFLKTRNVNALPPEQRTTVSTINNFIEKSKDAHKRGDYYQAFTMAQKANILAVSLAQN